MGMKYVGDGSFLHGIPSRDLTDEEVEQHGEKYLLDTGLYRKEYKKRKPNEDKSLVGPSEDKE